MSAAIVSTLAGANLALAGSVLAVLVLRGPVRRRFGALSAYLLWLTPVLCGLAALAPAPIEAAPLAPLVLTAGKAARSALPQALATPAAASLVVLVWLAGVIVTALLFAIRQARFTRSLGRLAPHPADPALLQGRHLGSGPMVLACRGRASWFRPISTPASRVRPASLCWPMSGFTWRAATRSPTPWPWPSSAWPGSIPWFTWARIACASTRKWPATRPCSSVARRRAGSMPRRCSTPCWLPASYRSAAIGRPAALIP